MIHDLPYGGSFDDARLIAHIKSSGLNYIIIGQQVCVFSNHTKPHSLDYWLRGFASHRDTKQAEDAVVDQLVATGKFKLSLNLKCPKTGRPCKGLVLA